MNCSGFVLTDDTDTVLAVSVDGSGDLVKAHVKGYARKDGAYVKDHDDKRQKTVKPPAFDHPHVVGQAENLQGGGADKAHSFDFQGKTFSATGKSGRSAHDDTPVRHFQDESGQPLWLDGKSRVHADSKDEVESLRAGPPGEKQEGGEPGSDPGKAGGIPSHIVDAVVAIATSMPGQPPEKLAEAINAILKPYLGQPAK